MTINILYVIPLCCQVCSTLMSFVNIKMWSTMFVIGSYNPINPPTLHSLFASVNVMPCGGEGNPGILTKEDISVPQDSNITLSINIDPGEF